MCTYLWFPRELNREYFVQVGTVSRAWVETFEWWFYGK
jgi:hypothetical protein